MRRRGLRSTDLADAVCLSILGAFSDQKKSTFTPEPVCFGDDLLEEANRFLN
jgi:hypothetical protein